jgi:hypothetical protein
LYFQRLVEKQLEKERLHEGSNMPASPPLHQLCILTPFTTSVPST